MVECDPDAGVAICGATPRPDDGADFRDGEVVPIPVGGLVGVQRLLAGALGAADREPLVGFDHG